MWVKPTRRLTHFAIRQRVIKRSRINMAQTPVGQQDAMFGFVLEIHFPLSGARQLFG
jgi:hypothetical protein